MVKLTSKQGHGLPLHSQPLSSTLGDYKEGFFACQEKFAGL
jgi:hypothetical protein